MKLYRPLVAAVLSLFLCISVLAQKMVFNGKVIDVLDGSTVVVETQAMSRFVVQCLAIKTPPPADSVSEDSRRRLASRVMGQTVTVEYLKPSENSRIVGTIFLNGDDVCLDQVRSGLAWFDREAQIGLSSSTRDVYATGEAGARTGGVGLWGTSQTPTIELNQPTTASVPMSTTGSTVDVRGYYRKDGTYVPPHKRTAPDERFENNWSTVGNVNPYTGKPGTKSWFSRNWWIFPTVGALIGTGFLLHRVDRGVDTSIGRIPCNDGTISPALNRQGACSHHGGIRP